jgi:hypothetical protein
MSRQDDKTKQDSSQGKRHIFLHASSRDAPEQYTQNTVAGLAVEKKVVARMMAKQLGRSSTLGILSESALRAEWVPRSMK